MATEIAVLGGGCFWCTEAVYLEVKGVTKVESGYTGGAQPNPTYEQVCAGTTGHAEVVRLEFDPEVIGYRDILEIFFTIHDPTTPNRQGNDVGTQYRSVIYYQSPEQEALARQVMAEMAHVWDAPIVTEISPAQPYYKAEDYHQNYFAQHPLQGYCAFVVEPKVTKFRKMHAARLKGQ
ncbi:peptide-methionine (S)-S-oxide reductase MsrA [Pseudoduganella chitinolytica]|uniref:Peptide methionine sulfoxide reductase MsrA n=1 Tax=Pseudoduganella chitinolytica TaxID=34070 RepID=A0ABY8B9K0_9BURK|nr:peptide-methionine (S)-S-oxide reductase MsrA [Pseudoduganella chitinolytica]WEF31417.1 peptide-methionine (S)-S-oxide reductase MsrA [Pseudoduganella chitinolytica]